MTKNFLEGEPQNATEEIFENDRLTSKISFIYNEVKKQFVPQKTLSYTYNEKGKVSSINQNRCNGICSRVYLSI
ncbi:hypothetical protein [Costertonia aggregata]|uniref:RHS repeat protein n=1 Tax=Costertonia aggregata TaxID=343403 RepID=A0A7H9AUK3_9FLAO|nr:hypothetical protein [Costertonia aggregata]QLG47168.1 hypothetical protein HYG79_17985 [Costertonia aggregata]